MALSFLAGSGDDSAENTKIPPFCQIAQLLSTMSDQTSSRDASQEVSDVSQTQKDPSSFLNEITGNDVVVKLNSGLEYHGM